MASVVAHSLGATTTVGTDYLPNIVEGLAHNLALNTPAGAPHPPRAALLRWGQSLAPAGLSPGCADVVLGGDVSYHGLPHGLLAQTVAELLRPGGAFLVCKTARIEDEERALERELLPTLGVRLVGWVREQQGERWREFGKVGHDSGHGDRAVHVLVFLKDT